MSWIQIPGTYGFAAVKRCRYRFSARRLATFLADKSGIAAVEFAYLVPILMLMTFGTFEVARGLIVHKRFQRTTAMVGDLVAREEQLGTNVAEAAAALDGIMRAAEHAMRPYSTTPLKFGIVQLRAAINDATKTTVEWSYSYHGKSVQACPTEKAMPTAGMVTAGNAAVLVESEYTYTPVLLNILPGLSQVMNWQDSMVFAPRDGSVDYGNVPIGTCP